jgi:hypothetical protein
MPGYIMQSRGMAHTPHLRNAGFTYVPANRHIFSAYDNASLASKPRQPTNHSINLYNLSSVLLEHQSLVSSFKVFSLT